MWPARNIACLIDLLLSGGEHLGNLEGRILLEEILALAPEFTLGAGVRRAYGEFLHGTVRLPIAFAPREVRS